MLSRFSQRWTVLSSRFRYRAISFHESSRSVGGPDEVEGLSVTLVGPGIAIRLPILLGRGGNRPHQAETAPFGVPAASCSLRVPRSPSILPQHDPRAGAAASQAVAKDA